MMDHAISQSDSASRRELLEKGYVCVPDILPAELLNRLRSVTDRLLDAQSEAARMYNRTQGSMLSATADPIFAELYTLPSAVGALAAMGWPDPAVSDGYVIAKPPNSPRLFWHYDWFSWEDPVSFSATHPPQLAFMYYLVDTRRENGCLRAIPGSHIAHNPLHDQLLEPHNAALSRGEAMDTPAFSDRPDEVDVPASARELLIVDARLLHAAHANKSDQRRTVITLWYQPDLPALPESIQAQMARKTQPIPPDWPDSARQLLTPMLASSRYHGSAEPSGRQLYRRSPIAMLNT
jgi:Phytanoyl-CoA dioxygenase (PhyH)